MNERGLAASTVDRRLSTVCGYYRFADIDGRISANPAQYVRPTTCPSRRSAWHGPRRTGRLLVHRRTVSPGHAALAVLLGLNGTAGEQTRSVRDHHRGFGFEHGHRTLRKWGAPWSFLDRRPRRASHDMDAACGRSCPRGRRGTARPSPHGRQDGFAAVRAHGNGVHQPVAAVGAGCGAVPRPARPAVTRWRMAVTRAQRSRPCRSGDTGNGLS
jgi:hypothetical protein